MTRPAVLRLLGAAVLVLATVLAYVPAMQGGFIWDDDAYVTENETLRTAEGLRAIWLDPARTPQYYPLVFSTFWLEYRIWQLRPLGYHVVNVLLHLAGALLLWAVLRRLAVPGAWLAAAVFALHPVHVESVAWITERKNVLSGAFYFASLLAYLGFCRPRHEAAPKPRRLGLYLASFGAFTAALLSKTVTCSLPAAVLLIMWWKQPRRWWREIPWLLPFFGLGLILARRTARLELVQVGAVYQDFGLSDLEHVLLAARIAWFYLGKLVWPADLAFIYPRWDVSSGVWWQFLFPLAALAVIAVLWLARRRIGRGPLVAVLFFGGTLFPALGFISVFPMTYSYVADHFQYHASVGPIALGAALATLGLRRLLDGWARRRKSPPPARAALAVPAVPAALVLAALAAITWGQGRVYEGPETLWRSTLAVNPNATMAHINLGNLVSNRGGYLEAMEHYRAATEVRPPERDPFVRARIHYNWGNSLYSLARYEEALTKYNRAIEIEARYTPAYYGRGTALWNLGRLDEAIASLERTLRLDPNHGPAQRELQRLRLIRERRRP